VGGDNQRQENNEETAASPNQPTPPP
jgi:hypothetical protein